MDNSNVPTYGYAWDHYLYAQNNPIRYNDPTGHCPWCIIIGIPVVGFAIGAASYQISTGTPWWSSKQALSGTVAAGAKGAATTIQAVVAIGALVAEGDPAPAEQVESDAEGDLASIAANSAPEKDSLSLSNDSNNTELPKLLIDPNKIPNVAKNILSAQSNGAPTILTRTTDPDLISANRLAATANFIGAESPDEYPFASTYEGGLGAYVKSVPLQEQHMQGGILSQFYRQNNILDGDQFKVEVKGLCLKLSGECNE